ncbi:unnamed protein product [Chrysoparadoxa australica]
MLGELWCLVLLFCSVNAFTLPFATYVDSTGLSAASTGQQVEETKADLRLTSLEGNSWVFNIDGVSILLDPVLDTLDFGVPSLIQVKKTTLPIKASTSNPLLKEVAMSTDAIAITQGFDDHCHEPSLAALSRLLPVDVPVVAPPSAQAMVSKYFQNVKYILPGEQTEINTDHGDVEMRATTGAILGPPWAQAENGYVFRGGKRKGKYAWDIYTEPHCMYDKEELQRIRAEVVVSPVVGQKLFGLYPILNGGEEAAELAMLLRAKTLVYLPNGENEMVGPVAKIVKQVGTVGAFTIKVSGGKSMRNQDGKNGRKLGKSRP